MITYRIDKVRQELENKTYGSDNFITVSVNKDARHKGKYVIRNLVTSNILGISFNTLEEIVNYYGLFKWNIV